MNFIKAVFILLFFGMSSKLFAQQAIPAGTYTVNSVEYIVMQKGKYGSFLVLRKNRPARQQNREVVNNIPLDYIQTRVTNEDVYKQLVKNTLGLTKLNALKQAGERIHITFYFTSAGEIIDVNYSISTTSLLTLNDIANIDKVLRENYTATFSSINNGHQYLYYVVINGEIDFTK